MLVLTASSTSMRFHGFFCKNKSVNFAKTFERYVSGRLRLPPLDPLGSHAGEIPWPSMCTIGLSLTMFVFAWRGENVHEEILSSEKHCDLRHCPRSCNGPAAWETSAQTKFSIVSSFHVVLWCKYGFSYSE